MSPVFFIFATAIDPQLVKQNTTRPWTAREAAAVSLCVLREVQRSCAVQLSSQERHTDDHRLRSHTAHQLSLIHI